MTEIPDRPFDKITIDLVTDCEMSTAGNKHIFTIIDHLTGWPEAFPIPDKSADTIVHYTYKPLFAGYMCPRYILSDNGMEFKNNLMDQVLQQLGIYRVFSTPYHPQSNGKLEVQVYQPGTHQLQDYTQLSYCRITIFSSLWQRPQSATTSTS